MSVVMKLRKENLEQIGSYIESYFDRFSPRSNIATIITLLTIFAK